MGKRTALIPQKTQKLSKRRRIRRCPKIPSTLKTKISQKAINSIIESNLKRFGRRETSSLEKTRIEKMKLLSRVFAQYFSQLAFSFISINNVISLKRIQAKRRKEKPLMAVKPEEITQFIEGNKWLFIKILACMAKDNHLPLHVLLQKEAFNRPDIENVPGSFMHGLDELRKLTAVDNEGNYLTLRPIDVKIFYLISLLLIGVPKFTQIPCHIDLPAEKTSLDQMVDTVFEKIVLKLLKETKILYSIAFEKLRQQWDIIMETVTVHQRNNNQNPALNNAKRALWLQSPPTIEQLKKILGKADRKESIIADQQIRIFIQSLQRRIRLEEDQDNVSQFLDNDSCLIGQKFDVDDDDDPLFQDLDSFNSGNFNHNDQNQQAPQILTVNQTQETIEIIAKKNDQKKDLISRKLAVKFFNFEQSKKRKNRKPAPQCKTKSKRNIHSGHLTEGMESSTCLSGFENLSSTYKNISFDESISNHNTSMWRTINDSMAENEESQSHTDQSANHPSSKNGPHMKRQIDRLIRKLNTEQLAIARAIANHIYHTMDVVQMRIEIEGMQVEQ